MGSEVTDPGLEKFSDEAFEPPGENGLTEEQLAFRIHMKREQAQQDAGWLEPPGPDEEPEPPEDSVETEEPPAPPELEPPEEEPEEPEESDEEEPDEEEPEEPAAEEDDFYLVTPQSRYKTREEAERAYAEKDRLHATQFEQINQLNQEVEQLRQWQQQQQAQQPPEVFDARGWSEWAAEVVEQGHGIQGAQRALQEGGREAHNIYMAYWKNSDDPQERIAAHIYDADVTRAFAAQQAVQAVSPYIEQQEQQGAVDEAEQARAMAAEGKDDFDELAPEMDRLIDPSSTLLSRDVKENLTAMAQGGGVHGKRMAWEYLYTAAKAVKGPERTRAQTVERKRRTTSADAARIAATVSTSEGSGSRTPPSEAEARELTKRNAIRKELGQPLLEEP